MARIANGEEGAVEELYDRFGSLVYRMAYQMLPSKSDAEDAVQEVFVRLWKTADRFDSTRAALSTWVVLITRRYLVDRLRRSRVRVKAALELQEQKSAGQTARELPVDDAELQERFTLLMSRIEKLPELQRAVLTRAYLGGQTLRQIGLELDRPIGTIKSTLSRAMVRLREQSVGGEEPVT
ncbi:MAG: RNA polymerase sigma factor [Planctomycetota bacterium]